MNLQFIIEKGQEIGEIPKKVDANTAAVFIITNMQGGVLISRSLESNSYMEIIVDQLKNYVKEKLEK